MRISDPRLGEVERTNNPLAVVCEADVVVREIVVKENRSEGFQVKPWCDAEKILQDAPSLRGIQAAAKALFDPTCGGRPERTLKSQCAGSGEGKRCVEFC